MFRQIQKVISIVILIAFFTTSIKSPAYAQLAQQEMMPRLPVPGVMVHLSPEFTPAHLQGITIHPDNALQFDFLIHKGDQALDINEKKLEYRKLVKYFLASLTIPDEDQWVNLSPYEKNRIIKDDFGKTEMGRDLLAQDYILKQITSSLIYPEDGLGKKFWDKVYERAWSEYHTTEIPVNTFNKVWIVPDQAYVYESGNSAYILQSHLKVMLEEDYLSLKKHTAITGSSPRPMGAVNDTHAIGSQLIREIILPELEKEINEGKNFASLRQMYSGMILATWYKKVLKESLLGKVYADKAKVKGVDQNPQTNEEIYRRYLRAFKKGVFNYIKEDVDKYTNETIPRKYFSGGFVRPANAAMTVTSNTPIKEIEAAAEKGQVVVVSEGNADVIRKLFPDFNMAALASDPLDSTRVTFAPEGGRNSILGGDKAITAQERSKQEFQSELESLLSLAQVDRDQTLRETLDLTSKDDELPYLERFKIITERILSRIDREWQQLEDAINSLEDQINAHTGTADEHEHEQELLRMLLSSPEIQDDRSLRQEVDGIQGTKLKKVTYLEKLFLIKGAIISKLEALKSKINEQYKNYEKRIQVRVEDVFAGRRLLLVDDEKDLVEINGLNAEMTGADVTIAYNGAQAQAYLKGSVPSSILTKYLDSGSILDANNSNVWEHASATSLRLKQGIRLKEDEVKNVVGDDIKIIWPILQILQKPPVKFDGVISDVDMPLMNGKELASFMSNEPGVSQIPALFWSGKYIEHKPFFVSLKGTNQNIRFFRKPVSIYALFSVLADAIEDRAMTGKVPGMSRRDLLRKGTQALLGVAVAKVLGPQRASAQSPIKNPFGGSAVDGIGQSTLTTPKEQPVATPVPGPMKLPPGGTIKDQEFTINVGLIDMVENLGQDRAREIIIKLAGDEGQRFLETWADQFNKIKFKGKVHDDWNNAYILLEGAFRERDKGNKNAVKGKIHMGLLPTISVKGIVTAPVNNKVKNLLDLNPTGVPDRAALSRNGGIDLNSANMNLQIRRDGRGVPLPLGQQDMAMLMKIQGFEPEIIEIRPAVNVPIITELQQKLQASTV